MLLERACHCLSKTPICCCVTGCWLLAAGLLIPSVTCADVLTDSYTAFTQTLGKVLFQPITDSVGSELQSIHIEYHNQPVSFQYQLWRLRPNSVCQPLKYSVLKYSACSEAASQFFRETCQTLQQQPNRSPNYPNYKRLYCNAAASYQPVIAKVRRSAPVGENAEQRQKCSMLTLKAARTRKNIDIYNRDKACGEDS
ncbi:hypothetical protein Q4488_04845 [Amphritea sp. 1_MG-2023]|uniref:hypothetical protein n=1 Tax=Amphritea sp. 1_MG-2023 TaxID=3062670 RepID=UPI0026E426F6|nr:hypothetical protein [Amphritea sp. 1_MG-2023]MDO6562705.1 hypothetical protein [Amphritea sp. 1_MG-2023]